MDVSVIRRKEGRGRGSVELVKKFLEKVLTNGLWSAILRT